MSNLLLNEYPLVILPSLAVKIGLNEAIFLQQLHYWLQKSDHEIDGYKWVYNTYEDWQKQLPFFSVMTIRRIVENLIKTGIIKSKYLANDKRNRTKWYSINYEELDNITNACVQNEQMDSVNLNTCSISTETTTETTNIHTDNEANASCIRYKNEEDIQKIVGQLPPEVKHTFRVPATALPKRFVKRIKKDQEAERRFIFDDLWARYPKRYGTNSKEAAYRAYKARMDEKEAIEVLDKGVDNYRAYCESESFVGTKWVMQASKFFGRDKHYLNYQEKQKERTIQDALIERLCREI